MCCVIILWLMVFKYQPAEWFSMPNSMTGFACEEIHASWGTLRCEIRSVNHRYLEPIIRLPDTPRALEIPMRQQCRQPVIRDGICRNPFNWAGFKDAMSHHLNNRERHETYYTTINS